MNPLFSRRDMLANVGTGFGRLALHDLLAREDAAGSSLRPHRPPKAKRCIFLFMPGGPSQIDLFDSNSVVLAQNGQPLPFEKPKSVRESTFEAHRTLLELIRARETEKVVQLFRSQLLGWQSYIDAVRVGEQQRESLDGPIPLKHSHSRVER